MTEHRDHQPGDIILDRYLPDATPEEREAARAQLHAFVAWQLRIVIRQIRSEQADSAARQERDTLDSADPPP
jgi:ribosome recycling factor